MKKTIVIYVTLLFSVLKLYAQEGSVRSLAPFTSISVAEGINVKLKAGTEPQAKITAHNIDLEDILTEVSGNRLKVHLEGNHHTNIKVTVEVTYTNLTSVKASSAASVVSMGIITADEFSVSASSAADINLTLEANKVTVDGSSAADIELAGTVKLQTVDLSSACDYKAYGLESKGAVVSVSSAADAHINVSESLDAHASSGGSIRYKGKPKKLYERTSSGGDIKQY